MSEHNITVEGGSSVRLLTAGKYCDRDIVVTSTGGGGTEDLDAVLNEQEGLIDRLSSALGCEEVEDNGVGDFLYRVKASNNEARIQANNEDLQRCVEKAENLPDYLEMAISNTLTEYSNDTITSIRAYSFRDATALKKVSLPALISSGAYSFQNTRLESVNMPLLENAANNMFYGSSLVSVNLPNVKTAYGGSFQSCTELKEADFSNATSINSNAFYGCSKLEKLILRRTSGICTLANVNAFTNSSIVSGTGFVYVPKELLSKYQSATNWSTYASQIRAIEDYPEITGG